MDIFDVLTLIGGLCLFLFGMDVMGESLKRAAGDSLRNILGKLTNNKFLGFLTGLAVTAVIQSSSATTVMVVGFVNSSLMTLKQAISVIFGANVGTTITAWILSLSGISGENLVIQLLKPSSFTPVLALIGIVLQMTAKTSKKKDVGAILLGFATLMFGMDAMSGAVSGLRDIPAFQQMFILFTNPILGVLVGAVLTAIIQSSSASVGILQALSVTGQVTNGAAIPIIMGQGIGTCVTAMISSVGTNRNARRAALVHLSINVIGTIVWLVVFWIFKVIFAPVLLTEAANYLSIAIINTAFKALNTALLLPMSGLLEKLAYVILPDAEAPEKTSILDERLMATPAIALAQSRAVALEMAECSVDCLKKALSSLENYSSALAKEIRQGEDLSDQYEDILGSYLVKLSAMNMSDSDERETTMLLKLIGDFERISDHSVNILESAEEMREKDLAFSPAAQREISVLTAAVSEILDLSLEAFRTGDIHTIYSVEPLEQVIDRLKEILRTNHILRLQQGECTIHVGFVWSDLLTNLERTADHCSNIAGCLIDMKSQDMNTHAHLRAMKASGGDFMKQLEAYSNKYAI